MSQNPKIISLTSAILFLLSLSSIYSFNIPSKYISSPSFISMINKSQKSRTILYASPKNNYHNSCSKNNPCALEKALTEGKTFREFSKELKPTLQKKGWWGEQIVVDSQGVAEKVQLGSMYRLKTIYSVNMQTAYQTGRYKTQYENVDNRPYWEYVAVMDASTRPEHAMLNGLVYRYDDPFWQSFYPPNGWRCRCRVNALSDYNLQKKNRTVSSSAGTLSEELALVSKKSGEYKPVTVYTDPLTGKRVAPDVGWSHNPASGLIEGN